MKTQPENRCFLITFIVPVILVLTAVVSMLLLQYRTVKITKNRTYQTLSNSADEQVAMLNEIFSSRLTVLEIFSNALAEQTNPFEIQDITARMNAIVMASDFENIAVAGLDGVAYTNDGQVNDSSDRFYVTEALAGRHAIQKLTDSRLYETNRLILSVPIHLDGKVAGVVMGSFSEKDVQELLISSAFDGCAYSFLIDTAGEIMITAEEPLLMLETDNLLDKFSNMQMLDGTTVECIKSNLQNGYSGVAAYSADGEKRYAIYQPTGFNDWYIFNVVPSAVADQTITEHNQLHLISIGTVTLCAILLLVIMALREKRRVLDMEVLQEQQLLRLRTDSVTGLLNEAGFTNAVEELLHDLPKQKFCAMLDIGILNFNQFSVSFGSPAGNAVLLSAARVLLDHCRVDQPCARLSGDHFACFAIDCESEDELLKQIGALKDKLLASEWAYQLQMSFGVYIVTDRTIPVEELCVRAVAARLSLSEDQYIGVYNQNVHQRMIEDAQLVADMDEGLRLEQFTPFYQPKYDARTERIVGAEALVRWIRPDGEVKPPDRFIRLFEQNRLITKLDRYMFERVCRKLGATDIAVPISINFSRAHLYDSDFPDVLKAIAEKYNVSPQLLEIELTETAFFDQPDELIKSMGRLRELGFLVSIDDFGSGYSSLNLLKDVHFDVVKLDKEFFSHTLESERGRAVVKSVLTLAETLKMHTVAEGVETAEQLEFLRENGCDTIQGYYFSHPVPEEEFNRLFREQENTKEVLSAQNRR